MKINTALIIMDGFGCSDSQEYNAVFQDGAKNITDLIKKYPSAKISTSGMDVGLPQGQMGNSEVGHLNIGAGRIVYQELTRITKSIEDGDFFLKPEFLGAIENCRRHDSALHLMGLCSDGGVHSHLTHLYALVELAKRNGLNKVFIHCFMDGRDVPPESGKAFIKELEHKLGEIGCGKIATVMGRYYAMDRDNRYERVEKAYAAMVYGEGVYSADPAGAVEQSYRNGVTDEFIVPIVVQKNAVISADDSVIFFNFRPDRAREITRALLFEDFGGFERKKGFFPLYYVSMTQYDKAFDGRLKVAFKPEPLTSTMGEYIADLGLSQLRIAETEKYAHVTFFFNGGVETPYKNEDRALIPSPKVATYDQKPEMSAYEVTDEVISRIESKKYNLIILNYANPDMVGHTGDMEAATRAVHVVDECVGRVVNCLLSNEGRAIITADHGNCEQMRDPVTGEPFTAHTTFKVPFIVADPELQGAKLRTDGRLSDISPTLLDMLGIAKPAEMTGESIIIK